MPKQSTAAALGLVILLLAVAVPAAVSVTTEPATATFDLDNGERATVTQTLQVLVDDTGSSQADIRLRDSATLESETQTLSEGETATYTVRNETMNVTLRSTGWNANATLAVSYPRTYGWAPGATTVIDNLPIMLVLVAFVVVMGGVVAALKR